jgi:hypothetical protein
MLWKLPANTASGTTASLPEVAVSTAWIATQNRWKKNCSAAALVRRHPGGSSQLSRKPGVNSGRKTQNVFGTWLGYSKQHDLLLQAGAAASDRLSGEPDRGMMVCHAANGEVVWHQPDLQYSGPCILHNDTMIANANSQKDSAGAWFLKTLNRG